MTTPTVFISHSFSDENWVREFGQSLTHHGWNVWPDHHAIQVGNSWREAMEKRLRESSIIILLVTPDTVGKPNLFFEIGAAIGMGKPVIPVISRNLDPSLLPPTLRERKYLIQSTPEATAQEFISQAMISG